MIFCMAQKKTSAKLAEKTNTECATANPWASRTGVNDVAQTTWLSA
jgi:hypothetical protein